MSVKTKRVALKWSFFGPVQFPIFNPSDVAVGKARQRGKGETSLIIVRDSA